MKADLHIHSCLSPCSALNMSPSRIWKKAKKAGLQLISLADHNHAGNNIAMYELSREDPGITCLYGMEITTREEIHILSYFDEVDKILDLGKWVYGLLPKTTHDHEKQGDQVVVDREETILEWIPRSLIYAAACDLHSLINKVHDMRGLAIPAHIDRPSYSLTSQLGFIPDEAFDALELTARGYQDQKDIKTLKGYPLITGSDSHDISTIGSNYFEFFKPIDSISNLYQYLNE